MRYLPNSPADIARMLDRIGAASVDDLFACIPESMRFKGALPLEAAMTEPALAAEFERMAANNAGCDLHRFLGAGACPHFAPAWVEQMSLRAEFFTAYTPYQPEISQGTLQAMFEFQSMAADLAGMEIANASMYDGGTALAEAVLMAARAAKGKQRTGILMAANVHPQWRETVHTYLVESAPHLTTVPFDPATGCMDLEALTARLDDTVAVVAVGYPSFLGTVQDFTGLAEAVHKAGALLVVAVNDLAALGMFKSPGAMGADIVVSDGLGMLGAPSYGGPGVGIFATRAAFMRQMPGRLVGVTKDVEGRRGFVVTLSTREQHIRREKATSNICTNHGLMALCLSMILAWWGKEGLAELATQNHAKAIFLRDALAAAGVKSLFGGPFFNEFAVALPRDAAATAEALVNDGFIAGLPLKSLYPELPDGGLLIAVNELHDRATLERFAQALAARS